MSAQTVFDIVIVKRVSLYGFTERINDMGTENLKTAPELLALEPQEAIQHEDDEDFNLVMDDGSWVHFEFHSKNEGLKGLKRFRVYEALASYQHKVPVTTYVLFSGKIKNPMTQFTEGVNTFKIVPVIMRGYNADRLIAELKRKQECKEKLTKEDMALLTVCLLMDGEMPLKDRVKEAFQITKEAASAGQEELDKVENVLYVMADKFLESAEMDELMEVIGVTRLGQKLVNRGIEQGIQRGMELGKEEEKIDIAQNLLGLLDEKVIAQRTGLPLETVMELKEKQTSIPVL